ncbi:MAG: PocR ligand-binding domain-containing protein [Chloroflexi bacterium]|nr:PocR ligand-binding domain-containing protein [Chloroflexota bacterium]
MNEMGALLTVRQLEDALQVDRMTVYRMIKGGRLPAFKVGGQWRFARADIERWLREQQQGIDTTVETVTPATNGDLMPEPSHLPLACVQAIQDMIAEVLGIGLVTTALDGTPVTGISNSCTFCDLILDSPAGRNGCVASWQAANQPSSAPWHRCHAGLAYTWQPVQVQGQRVALLLLGQFLVDDQRPDVAQLAAAYGLDRARLEAALAGVPVLDPARVDQLLRTRDRLTATIAEIGEERLNMLNRLRRIAEITAV